MKILHTADWHLGQVFFGTDRIREHEHFLNWLLQTVRMQRPDAVLISGDIFDTSNPPASAERLFWDFLDKLTRENPLMRVIITSGNHDSSDRLDAPSAIYRRIGVQVRSYVKKNEDKEVDWDDLCIPISSIKNPDDMAIVLAVPFLRSDDYENSGNVAASIRSFYSHLIKNASKRFPHVPCVMMSHIFAVGSKISNVEQDDYIVVGGENAVETADLSPKVAYMALGHIHRAQPVGGKNNIWYSGSALPMSFTEKNYKHAVNIVEIFSESEITVSRIEYSPLRKLLTVPATGVADFSEVMRLLSSFEKADKKDDSGLYPYVEVKVQEKNPDPSMVNAIQQEAMARKIHLCRIERVYPKSNAKNSEIEVCTTEEFQKLVPARIVREVYANVYGEEMPEDMARMLAEVKRACEEAEN